jgi:predicted RNase H-like nuclease (RuvC/YqgF family)
MIFTDENGNQVEAYTPDEVQAKLDETREETLEAANQAREEEVSDLSSQLQSKERELEEVKSKSSNMSGNLSGQRQIIEAKEKEAEELKKRLSEVEAKSDLTINLIKEKTLQERISAIAPDEEVAKKVKHYFSQFTGEPKDEKELDERIKNAYVLATNGLSQGVVNSAVMSSSSSMAVPNTMSSEKMTAEQLDLARKLGITDEDLKNIK